MGNMQIAGKNYESLPERLEKVSAEMPESIAIEHWEGESGELLQYPQTISYGQLLSRVRSMARFFSQHGATRGEVVAICLPRGIEVVIAGLAASHTGATVVFIDNSHPVHRVEFILQDSEAMVFVTDRDNIAFGERNSINLSDPDVQRSIAKTDDSELLVSGQGRHVNSNAIAYIVYTSGTTGMPKGVLVTHSQLVQMEKGFIFAGQPIRGTQLMGISFDAFIFDLVTTIHQGGTLCIPPKDGVAGKLLLEFLQACRPDEVTLTPSQAASIPLNENHVWMDSTFILGGEPVRPDLIKDLYNNRLAKSVINIYGPTEGTIYVTRTDTIVADGSWPTVGSPIPERTVYILDEHLQPVRGGEEGEIYISGAGVTPGYLGHAVRTASTFIADPRGEPGQVMYRTGDLGRWDADGNIVFRGRIDRQVKINGKRIELAEVEEIICGIEGVREATVQAHTAHSGLVYLRAWVVLEPASSITEATIISQVTTLAPKYMVPSRVVILDKIPRTPNGKVDVRSLPDPPAPSENLNGQKVGHVVDQGDKAVRQVLEAIADILDVIDPPLDSTFMGLGGSSLGAVRLAGRLRGTGIEVADLMKDPTVGEIISWVQNGNNVSYTPGDQSPTASLEISNYDVLDEIIYLREEGKSAPLFFIHGGTGLAVSYSGMASYIDRSVPLILLQAPALRAFYNYPEDMDALVANYVDKIRNIQPEGPYRLCGWSFGGWAAQEAARQLEEQGAEVSLLVIIDSVIQEISPEDISERKIVESISAHLDLKTPERQVPDSIDNLYSALKYGSPEFNKFTYEDTRRVVNLVMAHVSILAHHHIGVVNSPTFMVFSSSLGTQHPKVMAESWAPYLNGPISYASVAAEHDDMMRPFPQSLIGAMVNQCLAFGVSAYE